MPVTVPVWMGVQEGQIRAEDFEALCSSGRPGKLPPITDELAHWMGENQWAAVTLLQSLPVRPLRIFSRPPATPAAS